MKWKIIVSLLILSFIFSFSVYATTLTDSAQLGGGAILYGSSDYLN